MTQLNPVNAKEIFFSNELVPTGQLLEVVLAHARTVTSIASPPRIRTLKQRQQFGVELRDALNLLSVWAINPANKNLEEVSKNLLDWRITMRNALNLPSTIRTNFLRSLVDGTKCQLTPTQAGKVAKDFAIMSRQLLQAVTELLELIGYSSARRHHWVRTQLSVYSPLTAGDRMNRWRTFVKNGSWTRTFELLSLDAISGRPSVEPEYRQATAVGRTHATNLWKAVFEDWLEIFGPITGNEAGVVRLPPNVVIASNALRMLDVSIRFDPRSCFSADEEKALDKKTLANPEISLLLEARTYHKTCEYPQLSEVVEAAKAWLEDCHASSALLYVTVLALKDKKRLEALRSKLQANFSPAEQKELAELFANKT